MSATAPAAGRRQVAPVYGAGFVTAFGAHAVAANLGAYALARHDSLLELGLILGVYDAAEVVLKPVFGAVVDRRGAKKVMVGGLVAFGVASAAFAVGGDANLLGAARLAQGAAAAAFSPAAGAAVATLGGKKRSGRLFGGYGGAKGIGHLLGPVLGGALVVAGGYQLLFAVLGAVAFVAAAAVVWLVPDMAPVRRARSGVGQFARRVSQPSFLQPVLLLGAGTAALSAGVGFLPVLGYRHHLDAVATGAIVSLLSASAALLQPWAGRRLDRGEPHPAFAAGGLVVCAGGFALVAGLSSPVAMAAAAVAIGAGVAAVTPLGFVRLAATAPADRLGQTMGAGEVGRELGDAGGPALVGAFGSFGLGAGFAAIAVALVACAALALPRVTPPHGAPLEAPAT
ncbi:MFS transporter [Acidiferrimicrobium sp. IK]|uniref:MFS transporter n=1 Tax=Acidiferrimicrobium sp. IK TaxID=2871700 RepID=UPI0021CB2210|nr:MFS transporter [Acidiferrimicrobium sp. IK]MCU4184976.1 MFS transporter [Acidiferrimicrobium sp. IK]